MAVSETTFKSLAVSESTENCPAFGGVTVSKYLSILWWCHCQQRSLKPLESSVSKDLLSRWSQVSAKNCKSLVASLSTEIFPAFGRVQVSKELPILWWMVVSKSTTKNFPAFDCGHGVQDNKELQILGGVRVLVNKELSSLRWCHCQQTFSMSVKNSQSFGGVSNLVVS